jgi:hypothetical protein
MSGKSACSCPDEHLETLKRRLRECSNVLVIGFSGLDEHVLQIFDQQGLRPRHWAIVNGNSNRGYETFHRFEQHTAFKGFVAGDVVPTMGYGAFIKNELDSFIRGCRTA